MQEIIHKPYTNKLSQIIENPHYTMMGSHNDRIYCYSHRSGDFINFSQSEVSKGVIRRLAPADFWLSFCPVDKISSQSIMDNAAEMLCRASEEKGIFDVKKIRGCGAWIDNNKGVFHLGTKILIDERYEDVKKFKSDFVYPIKHDLMVKSSPVLPIEESRKLVNLCNKL